MNTGHTIQSAIDTLLGATGVPALPQTADTFKTGDPSTRLTGIVTTFLATADVIRQSAELGANLIITHEPTFYTAQDTDDLEWLGGDPIYDAKRRLIEQHGIAIWRFHDYWHMMQPDGIQLGVARRLGWTVDLSNVTMRDALVMLTGQGQGWDQHLASHATGVASIPPTTLFDLAQQVKAQLGATTVRYVGSGDLTCRRVALTIGAAPGKMTIAALRRDDVDVVICGETREWETCEYLRDAASFGRPKGMLVVGHAISEEPGMAYLAEWLRPHLPGVQITHVPAGDPFTSI